MFFLSKAFFVSVYKSCPRDFSNLVRIIKIFTFHFLETLFRGHTLVILSWIQFKTFKRMWFQLTFQYFRWEKFLKKTQHLLENLLQLTELRASHKLDESMERKIQISNLFKKLGNIKIYCATVSHDALLKNIITIRFGSKCQIQQQIYHLGSKCYK